MIQNSITGLLWKDWRLKEAGEESASHLLHTVHKVLFNVEALTERLRGLGHGFRVQPGFWLLRALWMGDARLLVPSLLAALSLEILFIGYRVEQNNCCNHSLCVCMCVCVCRCFLGHGVSVATCIVFVAMCCFEWICVWSHLLLSLACAQTMTPWTGGKMWRDSLNSSTMTILWSCSAYAIDEQVAVWIICFWFSRKHSEHCVILKTQPNCRHLDSNSHGTFSRSA